MNGLDRNLELYKLLNTSENVDGDIYFNWCIELIKNHELIRANVEEVIDGMLSRGTDINKIARLLGKLEDFTNSIKNKLIEKAGI